MKEIRLAVIPGDGIGKETVAAGKIVLDAVAAVHGGFRFRYEQFDWSCEYYAKHGRMMPENGLDLLRPHDAIFLGAVGYPGVPEAGDLLISAMKTALAKGIATPDIGGMSNTREVTATICDHLRRPASKS